MGVQRDDSLIGAQMRQQPKLNEHGNWPDSEIYGELKYDNQGNIEPYQFTPGSLVEVMAFLSDSPNYSIMRSYYDAVDDPLVITYLDLEEPETAWLGVTGAFPAWAILDANATVHGKDAAWRGNTSTGGVAVVGFVGICQLYNRGLLFQTNPVLPYLKLLVSAKSPEKHGDAFYKGDVDPIKTSPNNFFLPCFLREADYTQAIFDNGNVITVGFNTYLVKGLWYEHPPV